MVLTLSSVKHQTVFEFILINEQWLSQIVSCNLVHNFVQDCFLVAIYVNGTDSIGVGEVFIWTSLWRFLSVTVSYQCWHLWLAWHMQCGRGVQLVRCFRVWKRWWLVLYPCPISVFCRPFYQQFGTKVICHTWSGSYVEYNLALEPAWFCQEPARVWGLRGKSWCRCFYN